MPETTPHESWIRRRALETGVGVVIDSSFSPDAKRIAESVNRDIERSRTPRVTSSGNNNPMLRAKPRD